MTFFYKLIDFSQTCWYIISITIISGVNFRPKKCWAKVEQKSCEPKTRKNVIFRYTGSRKIFHILRYSGRRKKCYLFWKLEMMTSNEKMYGFPKASCWMKNIIWKRWTFARMQLIIEFSVYVRAHVCVCVSDMSRLYDGLCSRGHIT